MYEEIQHIEHRLLWLLKWPAAITALAQLTVLVGHESGREWPFFSYRAHLAALACSAGFAFLLAQAHLTLRILPSGLRFRFSPFQVFFRHLPWKEIKKIQVLPANEMPADAKIGFPGHDLARTWLIAAAGRSTVRIELLTGAEVFISTGQPEELLDFLENRKKMFGPHSREAVMEVGPVFSEQNLNSGFERIHFPGKPY